MRKFNTALSLSALLALACAFVPTASSAQTEDRSYVACNSSGDCWRVHHMYAYGESAPVTYYNGDWYDAHRADEHVRWVADPSDDRGYYERDGRWHADPAAHIVASGATGAGIGAAIGCLVTLPIGCLPGAAVGAAVGGGTGVVAGAASTPRE